ncbi:MAG: hypothetical protein ABH881_02540 [bacterium]
MSKNQNNKFDKLKNQIFNLLKKQDDQPKIEAIEKIMNTSSDKVRELINPSFAINNNIPETDEKENKKIVIVFKNYNQNQCEICKLDDVLAKALTSKLKHLTNITLKELPRSGLIRDDIQENGEYTPLFNNLEKDIALKEIKFSNESRFFGFFAEEYFSLVAIWVKHCNLH